MSASILYLHGFASGPTSFKSTVMKQWAEERGIPMAVPDLNGAGFSTLTVGSQLDIARAALSTLAPPVLVVGSSLGGYLASLLVKEPAIRAALLMCPAFDFPRRLARLLGDEAMAQWRSRGTMTVYHHSEKAERDVGIALVDEAVRHAPMPAMGVPCCIVHGRADVEVPVELSRLYARDNPGVKLVEVEDDHTLLQSMPAVLAEAETLLRPLTAA